MPNARIRAANVSITTGLGTPWKGLSSDRVALAWASGTVFANSDITLQGINDAAGYKSLTFGAVTITKSPFRISYAYKGKPLLAENNGYAKKESRPLLRRRYSTLQFSPRPSRAR